MIFAAGLGTRLRPLTDTMPKALVPVAGKPMLERVVDNLINAGFHDIIINIHHFGEQIIDFVNSRKFDANIIISDERNLLLDTGGGVKKALPMLEGNEPVLLHNADILTDVDLKALYNSHLESNADATLLVAKRNSSRCLFFSNGSLCGWMNKTNGATRPNGFSPAEEMEERAFSGIHVISPAIFREIEEYTAEPVFSIMPFYLSVCHKMNIRCCEQSAPYKWFDIGQPESLALANEELNPNR